MKSACEPFLGQKITLMGLGLLGRGVGDAAFLAGCGADVIVTDSKNEEELKESVDALKEYPNITFHLGGHREEDFTTADMVIKAAGVPLHSPYIEAAKGAGVPVAMSTALFAKYAMEAGANVIGVTGTRGKSTVAQMIYHSLHMAGKKAMLGGNVRGISTLAMLPEVESDSICILELDSWQLQGFGDLKISPHIAVFTNLMPDHQNYYPDMETYFSDKANIYRFQGERDVLVAGEEIRNRITAAREGSIVPPPIPADWQLKIPGEHNRANASFAAAALRALNLSETDIRAGLESFDAVEGRLQLIGTVGDVQIYNDNNATTPEATIAAIRSFPDARIILIAGGSDKGLSLKMLARTIDERVQGGLVLLSGTGTEKLKNETSVPYAEFDTIAAALARAVEIAQLKDIVLFSPGFASFGMFKNEYDRNDQFIKAVRELQR